MTDALTLTILAAGHRGQWQAPGFAWGEEESAAGQVAL